MSQFRGRFCAQSIIILPLLYLSCLFLEPGAGQTDHSKTYQVHANRKTNLEGTYIVVSLELRKYVGRMLCENGTLVFMLTNFEMF